ncbi:MAG: elongator complex protein 3 [Oscillospiraceae bacterium]
MKKTNVSIFIPHIGCPHRCTFCDQRSISGAVKAPSAADVSRVLEEQAGHLAERGFMAEIAFFGGSFTAVPRAYMLELLEAARTARERFPVYSGIRCSTRPDCVSEEIVSVLRGYGVTAVELGAQSMDDEVLRLNERGHTAEDVRRASELIKRSGIELGLQMMTGLWGDSPEKSLRTAEEFIKIHPAAVRIYPTVILRGTRLGELYESGKYRSFSFEETVDLCAELLRRFEDNGISVIRMGLHASPDVEREMLSGVYHPAFREIVESRLFLRDMQTRLSRMEKGRYTVLTDNRNISKAVGQKRANIEELRKLGYEISVKPKNGAYIEITENNSAR